MEAMLPRGGGGGGGGGDSSKPLGGPDWFWFNMCNVYNMWCCCDDYGVKRPRSRGWKPNSGNVSYGQHAWNEIVRSPIKTNIVVDTIVGYVRITGVIIKVESTKRLYVWRAPCASYVAGKLFNGTRLNKKNNAEVVTAYNVLTIDSKH